MVMLVGARLALPLAELRRSGHHGYRRWCLVVERDLQAQYGQDNGTPLPHILGAWGECAVAHALGLHWPTDSGPDGHRADVGGWHVRTTRRRSDGDERLVVRSNDPGSAPFLLVIADGAVAFRIMGWLYASEARRPEWRESRQGRPPSWFAPWRDLRPWPNSVAPSA